MMARSALPCLMWHVRAMIISSAGCRVDSTALEDERKWFRLSCNNALSGTTWVRIDILILMLLSGM
jgi:hypothetical protein